MSNARELAELSGSYGTGGFVGMKNRIINGAMQVWQRGTTISVGGSDIYTADRWVGIASGANYTASQASYSLGGITKNSLVISGAASNTVSDIAQRIESVNAYDLAGSVCTVSADVYTTDGTSVTWEVYSANTANTFSAKTLIATGTLSTTAGSYTQKTFSFTASSAVSNGLEIRFKFGSLLSGKQGALGAVQLEKGSTATSFDIRPYGTEVALCQRYFQASRRFHAGATNSNQDMTWLIPVTMRSPPSIPWTDAASTLNKLTTNSGNNVSLNAGGIATTIDTVLIQANTVSSYVWYEFYSTLSAEL